MFVTYDDSFLGPVNRFERNLTMSRLVMSLGAIKCYANEFPDMSNGNRTRETTCDICLCLRKFLSSEVNILKSGNTIPNRI